jgi:hypothetical protein
MNLPKEFTVTLTPEHLERGRARMGGNSIVGTCLVAQAIKPVLGESAYAGMDQTHVGNDDGLTTVASYDAGDLHLAWVRWFDFEAVNNPDLTLDDAGLPLTLTYRRVRVR